MNNRVETLRALCFTKEDLETITNLGDSFTEKDIEFMVEFKKIYELGLSQLKKFIDKLDEEGKDLDTYSIMYYIEVLLNGPLGSYVREFSKDKKYFVNSPDIMGMLGNRIVSHQNNTIHEDGSYMLGCAVDTYNKLPPFIQTTITNSIKQTENVFRSSLKSSSETDNTLPIVDKANQTRYAEEKLGKWVIKPVGNYMIKDSYFYLTVNDVSEDIFKKVEDYLGEEDFRMYGDKKKFNPFDSEKNTSKSTNSQIKKVFKDGDKEREVVLDLMGDEFDSDEIRSSKIKISGIERDKEYLLHTNSGQLGN
jgi:hypothetical protein